MVGEGENERKRYGLGIIYLPVSYCMALILTHFSSFQ